MKTLQVPTFHTDESQESIIQLPIQRELDGNNNSFYHDQNSYQQDGSYRMESILLLDQETMTLFGMNKEKMTKQLRKSMSKELFLTVDLQMTKSELLTVTFTTSLKKYNFRVEYTLISLSTAKKYAKAYKVVFILSKNREIKVYISKEFIKLLLKILQSLNMKYYFNEKSKIQESQMLSNAILKHSRKKEERDFAIVCNYNGEEGYILVKNGEEFIVVSDNNCVFKRFNQLVLVKEGSYWVEIDDFWLSFVNKGQKLSFLFEIHSNINKSKEDQDNDQLRYKSQRKETLRQDFLNLEMPMMRTELKNAERAFTIDESTNLIQSNQNIHQTEIIQEQNFGTKLNFNKQDSKALQIKQEIDLENIEIQEEINGSKDGSEIQQKQKQLENNIHEDKLVQKENRIQKIEYNQIECEYENQEVLKEPILRQDDENRMKDEKIYSPEKKLQCSLLDVLQLSQRSLLTLQQDNNLHFYHQNNNIFDKSTLNLSYHSLLIQPSSLFYSTQDFKVNFIDSTRKNLFTYDLNSEAVERICDFSHLIQDEIKDLKMLDANVYTVLSSSAIHIADSRDGLIHNYRKKNYRSQRYEFQKMDILHHKIVVGQEDGKIKMLDLRNLSKRSINNFDLRMDTFKKGLYYRRKQNNSTLFQSFKILPESSDIFCTYDNKAFVIESKSKNNQKSIFNNSVRYYDRHFIRKYPDDLREKVLSSEQESKYPVKWSINHQGSQLMRYSQRQANLFNLKTKIISPLSLQLSGRTLCYLDFGAFRANSLIYGIRQKGQIQFRSIYQ